MLIQMVREDDKEARAVDAELDAADAASDAVGAGPATAGAAPGTAGPPQPWWESDPRFTGRFRRPDGA